jgi:putative oxidoreductase
MSTSTTVHETVPTTPATGTTLSSVRAACSRTLAGLRRAEPYGQSAVLLALRLLYGWQLAQTGWGKLAHLERTAGFFEGLGLPAPAALAALVGGTELVGGVLLAVGFGTRLAAAALTTVMLTAFFTAHAAEAFQSVSAFTEQAPFPFLVATLILLGFGAGRLSFDGWLGARAAGRATGGGAKVERPACQC